MNSKITILLTLLIVLTLSCGNSLQEEIIVIPEPLSLERNNPMVLPKWHGSAGAATWIFLDEIIVN